MFAVLAPRSVNLVQTFHEKKTGIESRNPGARVMPGVNLQMARDGGSLDGVFSTIPLESRLGALELTSENLYSGISICRCTSDDATMRKLARAPDRVRNLLDTVTDKSQKLPRLNEVLPPDEHDDFWWSGVSCVLKCPDKTRKALNRDYETNAVNFYNLYEMSTSAGDPGIDNALRDGCAWQPCVRNGMIALYEQRGGDRPGFFLVCVSAMPSLGSELVRAIKSDVAGHCNARDFCDSKEAWFLENIARRNRLRCIARAAAVLGISVHMEDDALAHRSQEAEKIAVETLGVVYENLYIDETCPEQRVVHARGCVDSSRGAGPIPLLVGAGQEIIIFEPESSLRSCSGVENDLCPLSQRSPNETVHPFPVVNVSEQSIASTELIEQETNCLRRLHVSDVSNNIQTQQLKVSEEAASLLGIVDNYGSFMLYGLRYEEPLPLLLCPNIVSRYVAAEEDRGKPWSENRETKPRRRVNVAKKYRSSIITQKEVADMFFMDRKREQKQLVDHFGFVEESEKPEQTNVVLAWEQNMTAFVAQIVSDGTHGMEFMALQPIAFVCN